MFCRLGWSTVNIPLFVVVCAGIAASECLTQPVGALCTFFLAGSPVILVVAQKVCTFFWLVTGQVSCCLSFLGIRHSAEAWRQRLGGPLRCVRLQPFLAKPRGRLGPESSGKKHEKAPRKPQAIPWKLPGPLWKIWFHLQRPSGKRSSEGV